MKRFDDVLRMLSGILLGIMVRDFDLMSTNLCAFCGGNPQNGIEYLVAFCAVLMLLAIFLRNIHGSARYDEYVENEKCRSIIERNIPGRFFIWLLYICALFLGPSLAGRRLARGFKLTDSIGWLAAMLFFSLAVYIVWDFVLWFFPLEKTAENGQVERRLEDVVRNWVKIDGVALLLGMISVAVYWFVVLNCRENVQRLLVAVSFVVISCFMLVGDYWKNRQFYFPSRH